ncbi:MAG: preprotein translocase subunit SecA [Endomicrobium sp.]|jgi:preprotein translocase subunit SecA|nr:preprotein translocase subunit SecA [Endomicrobium sp.]
MIKGILKNIFGSQNYRDLKVIKLIVNKVNALELLIKKLTDKELKNKTIEFKQRILQGQTLDEILPEAFACVREASVRTIGLRHFDVQIMGGYILHNGKIAEMKTGEGKTLVATLPAYLNALSGNGVHIVTVNDYLAKRDHNWMKAIYEKLGLTVGYIEQSTTTKNRKIAYHCDITYVTNNELGFDYLRDNMVLRKNDKVLRTLHYAIVDEIDSILIDEARTPLIISGNSELKDKKYYISNSIVLQLKGKYITEEEEIKAKYSGISLESGSDYIIDEKNHSVSLTENGIKKSEKLLGITNLYDDVQSEWVHHILQAIKANKLFHKNIDYVVKDDNIVIVDEFTGRLMYGRRWADGLHQAIEAKEHLTIHNENITLATITFQNFFRMYRKLSGMTGTALNEANEFWKIYKLGVVEVPTNKPMIRKDYPDVIYRTEKEKIHAIIQEIELCWRKGQPVLVGTRSIEKSERISKYLTDRGIPHNVLNAKHNEIEAKIIANAGVIRAVTIATNMAGRGTDIILGAGNIDQREEIKKYGGLHIIGTERHESRRIDNQLRGRSGRQGDPGSSRFFLSMEDELMRLFGSDKISIFMRKLGLKDNEDIQHPWITKAIATAQKKIENMNFDLRKQLIDFDDVINKQREIIYKLRNNIIEKDNINIIVYFFIKDSILNHINSLAKGNKYLTYNDLKNIRNWILNTFLFQYKFNNSKSLIKQDKIKYDILKEILKIYKAKLENIQINIQQIIILQTIDISWRQNLSCLEQLKHGVSFRAYAHQDPKLEYQQEAFILFRSMMNKIRDKSIEHIFKICIDKTY